MTSSSRVLAIRKARAEMSAVRQRIVETAAPRSDEELLRRPDDGGWSAAEVLDHIGTAEKLLVKALLKMEKGERVRIPRRAWFYRLPMSPVFWPIRIPAPKLVRPRPAVEISPRVVLQELETSRRGLLDFADRQGEEGFARLIYPHFLLGRFSGLDWFRFITRHETKHAGQLERALAASSGERTAVAG
jgi:hypothetical protein